MIFLSRSPAEAIRERYQERLKSGKKRLLNGDERHMLIADFVNRLQSAQTKEEVRNLCVKEISFLEQGYPKETISKNHIQLYRKAIVEAVEHGKLSLTGELGQSAPDRQLNGATSKQHVSLDFMKYDLETYRLIREEGEKPKRVHSEALEYGESGEAPEKPSSSPLKQFKPSSDRVPKENGQSVLYRELGSLLGDLKRIPPRMVGESPEALCQKIFVERVFEEGLSREGFTKVVLRLSVEDSRGRYKELCHISVDIEQQKAQAAPGKVNLYHNDQWTLEARNIAPDRRSILCDDLFPQTILTKGKTATTASLIVGLNRVGIDSHRLENRSLSEKFAFASNLYITKNLDRMREAGYQFERQLMRSRRQEVEMSPIAQTYRLQLKERELSIKLTHSRDLSHEQVIASIFNRETAYHLDPKSASTMSLKTLVVERKTEYQGKTGRVDTLTLRLDKHLVTMQMKGLERHQSLEKVLEGRLSRTLTHQIREERRHERQRER